MRFAFGFLVLAVALGGCTASPLDAMNRLGTTAEAEPFPANYKDLLRHQYGLNRPRDLEVSYPRTVLADNAFAPARWYVCIRSAAGVHNLHIITKGKLEGTVSLPEPADSEPSPNLCDGGQYGPLG